MNVTPQRDKVVVRVLPSPEANGLIVRAQTDTPIRRVEVVGVGPDATVELGHVYLANVLSGQQMGDDLMVLPSRSGKSAFLAEWME